MFHFIFELFVFNHITAGRKKKPTLVQVQNINYPKYFEESGEGSLSESIISKDQYARIHSFKNYMDSLASDAVGKAIYDSIVANRPGLLDSIKLLEEVYHSQQ